MKLSVALLLALIALPVFGQTVTTVAGPTIKLQWVAPTKNTNGAALTGTTTYNLYQGACNPTATFAKVQTGIAFLSAVVSAGITTGPTYGFRVTAVNGGGESAQSPTVCATIGSVTTTPATLPNPPTAFAVMTN